MSVEDNKTTPLILDYTSPWDTAKRVLPKLNMYANNNNLYVGFDYFDTDCNTWLPYIDVTVNLLSLPFLESAIDTNNNGKGIVEWLETNGFGEPTGEFIESGFCIFPVFRFNEEKLKEIDIYMFNQYEKACNKNQNLQSLKKAIENARQRRCDISKDQSSHIHIKDSKDER